MLRGKALRDAFILRLLAAERFIRGVLLVALAYGVYRFNGAQDSLRAGLRRLPADRCSRSPTSSASTCRPPARCKLIQKALDHRPQHARAGRHRRPGLRRAGAARGCRAVADEALGRVRRGGRHRGVHPAGGLRARRAGHLAAGGRRSRSTSFAVVYILWTKRLFGFRGGRAAFEAERHSESLLEVERPPRPPEPRHWRGDRGAADRRQVQRSEAGTKSRVRSPV